MTRRLAKKVAKRFLDGRDCRRWIRGTEEYRANEDTYVTTLVFPGRIYRAIYAEAYRRGWNGCHWDSPLVVDIQSYDDY